MTIKRQEETKINRNEEKKKTKNRFLLRVIVLKECAFCFFYV